MKQHVSLFTMATTMWTAFLLGGLSSDYYLKWPQSAQLTWLVVVPTLTLVVVVHARTRRMPPERARVAAFLTAFYFTVPYLAYDYVYLGVHQGRGWTFLTSHWYLTAFYAVPWLTLPWLTVRRGQRPDAVARLRRLDEPPPSTSSVPNASAHG